MDERVLRALVAAGAVTQISIIASGARFHVEAKTPNGAVAAETRKGKVKTWATLDAAARWVRSLGIGGVQVNLTHWQPGQREMSIKNAEERPAARSGHHGSRENQGELFTRPLEI